MDPKEIEKQQTLSGQVLEVKRPYTNRRAKILELLRLLFWIGLVVALGMFAVNQSFEFFYKAHLLKQPCHLCAELNPNQSSCINYCFTERVELYPDGMGGWKTQDSECYDLMGKEIECAKSYDHNVNVSLLLE